MKDKDATIKPPAGDQGPAPAAEAAPATLQAPPAEADRPAAEEAKPTPKKKRGLLSRIPGLGGGDK